jgi:hypothetical protein
MLNIASMPILVTRTDTYSTDSGFDNALSEATTDFQCNSPKSSLLFMDHGEHMQFQRKTITTVGTAMNEPLSIRPKFRQFNLLPQVQEFRHASMTHHLSCQKVMKVSLSRDLSYESGALGPNCQFLKGYIVRTAYLPCSCGPQKCKGTAGRAIFPTLLQKQEPTRLASMQVNASGT